MTTAVQPFTGSYAADRDHSSFQAELRHMGVGHQAQLPRGGDVLSWTVTLSIHLELVADAG